MLGLVAVHRLSLAVGRGLLFPVLQGLSSLWLLLLWSTRSRHMALWPMGLTAPRHVESSRPGIGPVYPTLAGISQPLDHQGSPVASFFFPLNLFIFSLRTATILLASAIHQHRSAIVILMSPPLWKSFNPAILCSRSCPCRSGHNVPLMTRQKVLSVVPLFISIRMGKCYTPYVLSLENSSGPQSCLTLCDPIGCNPPGSSVHGGSPGKNAGVGCHFLLQEIYLTEGSTQVSCVAGKFFNICVTRKAHQ